MADLSEYPAMLPYPLIERAVALMEYRPGWRLLTFLDPHEGPKLRIVAEVVDGYHPEQTVPLGITSRIPSIVRTVEDLKEWVLWRLLEVEAHECREYFRFAGELVRDPHDPLEPAG